MIDLEHYERILNEGLLLDHYYLMCNIRDGRELAKRKRIDGFINLLHKKGYIEDGALTEKAMILMGNEPSTDKPTVKFEEKKPHIENVGKFDFAGWVISLHEKCAEEIKNATGKRQAQAIINGTKYPFLANPTTIGKSIARASRTYNLTDFDKIEATIMWYVKKCCKDKNWSPLLMYWIIKNDNSFMVTKMEEREEVEEDNHDSGINI